MSAKQESDSFNHECDYRPNWMTMDDEVLLPINHNYN